MWAVYARNKAKRVLFCMVQVAAGQFKNHFRAVSFGKNHYRRALEMTTNDLHKWKTGK